MLNATPALSPAALRTGSRRRRPRVLAGAVAALRAVAVPGGAAAAGVAPALPARVVQERLAALGHLPLAAVTGRFDHTTLDAVARFQAARGLRVDGVPGEQTADALLRAV